MVKASSAVWSPSPSLSPRVRRLREEYFSFYTPRLLPQRGAALYGSGTPWDEVWSPYHWAVAPELYPFMDAYRDSLLAAAERVPLPAGLLA